MLVQKEVGKNRDGRRERWRPGGEGGGRKGEDSCRGGGRKGEGNKIGQGQQWEGKEGEGGGGDSIPEEGVGLSRIILETSCRTAWPSEATAPQARLTAPSAFSLDPPDSSSHLGDSGSQACAEGDKD